MSINKKLLNCVTFGLVLSLFFSNLTFASGTVKASSIVVQDDGEIVLVMDDQVLGDTASPSPKPATTQQPSATNPPSSNSDKSTVPKSTPAPSPAAKTVPLVPANSPSIIQANPTKSGDSKLQVTITQVPSPQPSSNPAKNSPPASAAPVKTPTAGNKSSPSPQPTLLPGSKLPVASAKPSLPSPSPSSTANNQQNTTSPTAIKETVNQVILQGKSKQPILSIKQDQSNQIVVQQDNTQVTTNLPIQINTQNHSLSVVGASGTSVLNLLPKEALKGVVSQGIINNIDSSNLASPKVTLTEESGNIEYKINSQRTGKLLGLFNVSTPVEVKMSAQTGAVLSVNQSPIFNLLGAFIK